MKGELNLQVIVRFWRRSLFWGWKNAEEHIVFILQTYCEWSDAQTCPVMLHKDLKEESRRENGGIKSEL